MDTMSVDVTTVRSTASIAGTRDSTRNFLDRLVRPLAAETADTVVLVVSELVTNALRHAGGTGGFGWPMVNRLASASTTAVARRPSGGKTARAVLPR